MGTPSEGLTAQSDCKRTEMKSRPKRERQEEPGKQSFTKLEPKQTLQKFGGKKVP